MWTLSLPWWQFVVRALIIYAFLLILLRISGKRQVGQMAPFDLVLLLVLSNAVQNAMNAGDNSVLAGFLLAGTLVAINVFVGWISRRSKRFERVVEGRPEVIIHNGKLYEDVLRRNDLTEHDLSSALRAAGCASADDVHLAMLETNGKINVLPRMPTNLPPKSGSQP